MAKRPTKNDWLTIIEVVERWVAYAKSRGWCPRWNAEEMRSAGQLVLARAWHAYDARRSGAYTFASMVLRQRIGRVYEQEHRGQHSRIEQEPLAPAVDELPARTDHSLAERVGRMAALALASERNERNERNAPRRRSTRR